MTPWGHLIKLTLVSKGIYQHMYFLKLKIGEGYMQFSVSFIFPLEPFENICQRLTNTSNHCRIIVEIVL